MSGVLSILSGQSVGVPSQCPTPTINPDGGNTPRAIVLHDTQAGTHLFYTRVTDPFSGPAGIDPTHSGDTPTGSTIRVGTNSIGTNTGTGFVVIRVLAYQAGYLDSEIAEGTYDAGGP